MLIEILNVIWPLAAIVFLIILAWIVNDLDSKRIFEPHGEIEKILNEIDLNLKESSRMVGGANEKVGIILDELRGNRVDIAEAKCGASDDAPAKPSSLEDVLNSIKEDI